ncbi:glycosyltransferase family 4 protein [Sphingopyxis kveilinensis]|uniref:glycosyltransferase family 4 protein n=1 Tax=Sphingopyxis kveilinensis TaxID=3114367 RepID=UPI0030D592EF
MKIMFVLAGLGAGGAERVLSLLSGEMIHRGHDISVVSFDAPGDPVFHSLDPQVDIVRLAIPAGGGSPLRGAAAICRRTAALRGLFKRRQPDVVISFLTKINVLSIVASTRLGIPVVISERNNPVAQRAHPLWAMAWKLAARRAAGIVLQTQAIKELYPAAIRSRAVVIPNPVVPVVVKPEPHDGLVLTAVGRLDWQKGFDMLIKAFAILAKGFPEWKLVIWGEGKEKAELQSLADRTGCANQIELAGKSHGPADWIKKADLFVLSSRYEGFPNVLLEAMAAAIPAVSFRCQFGPEEIINDGANGLLVEAENIESLSQALRKMMENKGLRDKFSSAGPSSVAHYGVGEIVSKWEAFVKKEIYTKGK